METGQIVWDMIDRRDQEIARLRAALEPFAAHATEKNKSKLWIEVDAGLIYTAAAALADAARPGGAGGA
jgi:hypothetical protein